MNNADLYNKSKSLQNRDAEDVLDAYLPLMNWKPNQTFIDIGCGDGDISVNLLMKKVPSDSGFMVAVDRSLEMLKFASENYPRPNVDYQYMNIGLANAGLNHGNVYDHLFSFNCIHWVQDQTCAMKNVYDLLKNGGDFLLTMIAKHHIFDSYKVLSQNHRWKEFMTDYESSISPYNDSINPVADFRKILNFVGFENVYVDHVYKKHTFNGHDCLQATAAAVNPFLKKIPSQLHQKYLNDYMNYVKGLGFTGEDENEVGKYTYSVLMAYGVKKF